MKLDSHTIAEAAQNIGISAEDLAAGAVEDSSGYRFGSKLYLAPAIGVRVFLSNSLQLNQALNP